MAAKLYYLFCAIAVLAVFGCASNRTGAPELINQEASAVAGLPSNPLQWRVISSGIERQPATMSTLYGNDSAVQYARANSDGAYPAGSVLSLVTWTQQADKRWFGAKIPQKVRLVEFVWVESTPDRLPSYRYQSYSGSPLKKVNTEVSRTPQGRISSILSQRAAVMP